MVVWALLCHSCGFACQQGVLKTLPGPGYLRSVDGVVWLWHLLVNLYIWLTISSCYGSLTLGLIGRDGGLSTLMSKLWVCLSGEGAKNASWPWLSPFRGWGSLTIAFTGKFVYMSHHFILLRLNLFNLRVDREGWWFDHSCVMVAGFLVSRGCQKRFLALAISARRIG